MKKLSLNKASKLLGIPRGVLKSDIRSGKLPMSDGALLDEDLERVYPDAVNRMERGNLDYYDAMKETAGSWKDDARTKLAATASNTELVNRIRRQDAEIHMLRKRIADLEDQLLRT